EADVYVMVDGDDTYEPEAARTMVDLLLDAHLDMVVGTRQPAATDGDEFPAGHALGNRAFSGLFRLIFGSEEADAFSGYRVMSRRFVKSFPARTSGFDTETELVAHAAELRLEVAEVPVKYFARPEGSESKLGTYRDGLKILWSAMRLFRDLRPKAFFGMLFTLLTAVSVVHGAGRPRLPRHRAGPSVPDGHPGRVHRDRGRAPPGVGARHLVGPAGQPRAATARVPGRGARGPAGSRPMSAPEPDAGGATVAGPDRADPDRTDPDRADPGAPPTPSEDASQAAPPGRTAFLRSPTTWVALAVVVLAVVVGVLLRVHYYTEIEPGPDADEAEMGLIARELLGGEFPVLMRLQPYGGTPWAFVVAASVRLFGMTPTGLRAPTVLLGLVNAVLIAWIASSMGWSRTRSVVVGAVAWCYPIAWVYFGSRETLYFIPSVTAGLVALLLVLRSERVRPPDGPFGEPRRSLWLLVGSGFAAGVGLWINPGSLYLTLPTFLWLGVRSLQRARAVEGATARVRSLWRPVWPVLLGALAGSFPWWFMTLFGIGRPDNYATRAVVPALRRLRLFGTQQFAGLTGFKPPFGTVIDAAPWLFGRPAQVLYVAAVVLLVVQAVRPGRDRLERVLGVVLLTTPVVYLLVSAKAGPVYVNLRYIFFVYPVLPLLVGAKWRRDLVAVLVLAALPVLSFVGMQRTEVDRVAPVEETAELLRARGARCVISDYWAGGNRLAFRLGGTVPVVSLYANRNPIYVQRAKNLGNCPWVYSQGQATAAAFEAYLAARGIGFERQLLDDGLVVYFPERRVWFTDVPMTARTG
ncbi:MAG: hypothetical protein ACKO04_10505, partial [Actinomycetes bacterium]